MNRRHVGWALAQVISLCSAAGCLVAANSILNQPPPVARTSVVPGGKATITVGTFGHLTRGCLTLETSADLMNRLVVVPANANVTARNMTIGGNVAHYGIPTTVQVVSLTTREAATKYNINVPPRCLAEFGIRTMTNAQTSDTDQDLEESLLVVIGLQQPTTIGANASQPALPPPN